MKEHFIDSKKIIDWGTNIFQKAGVPADDSFLIVKSLVDTSLWGTDSHGIARIPHYLNRFTRGSIKTNPHIKFNKTGDATGQVDGDDGHGIVIMTKATEHAIQLAKAAGMGAVGVYNSSHCGAIGLYTRQITAAGMVGFSFTHTDALVVPTGGKKAFLGTNPISIAFPTENPEEPVCCDMATSIVPWNFIVNSRRENNPVPSGLGVDSEGNDSENAHDIVALKPIGDYKGYALAFMIDLLCGPLNGMPFGTNISSMYKDLDNTRKLGSLVIALDPERFGGRDAVQKTATAMINQIKQQSDQILFPGEPEYIEKKVRIKMGIPVSEALMSEFNEWSEKIGVPGVS